jgi:lipopolysaccharide export system protein LptA
MSKAALLSLAALLALGVSPLVRAEPPARPLTEAELLKTLDGLGKGDPVTKAPLSAEPALPKRETTKTPAPAEPRSPRSASTTPKPDLLGAGAGTTTQSESRKKDPKEKTPMPGSTPGQTEITSEEAAFDQRTHQAVFMKNVFVRNPDFTLSCDKLTAYMKHDDDKTKKGAPAAGGADPGPGRTALPTLDAPGVQVTGTPAPHKKGGGSDPGAGGPGGGLDKAHAEGNVEIIQDKVADDGTISHNVGHGKTADYDSAEGSITLRGKPDVQQGINSCEALDEETIIILFRDGHMKTIGRTKNIIRESTATPAPKPASVTSNGR